MKKRTAQSILLTLAIIMVIGVLVFDGYVMGWSYPLVAVGIVAMFVGLVYLVDRASYGDE